MRPLESIYGEKFFAKRKRYHWRWPFVCGAVNYIFTDLKRVIDVGCAAGDLVYGFDCLGFESWGIEGPMTCWPYLVCNKKRVVIHDLRKPLDLVPFGGERFDLVTCWEVAEHIEPEYTDIYLNTLCMLSDKLLISACPPNPAGKPGKGSVGHFNEQPPSYWQDKFRPRGYVRGVRVEERFRNCVFPFRGKYGIKAFWDNVLFFAKQK